MWPTKYNIVNLVQEEDWSCSVMRLDWSVIYWSNNKSEFSGKIDIDLPCLISALYDQHPDLFSKFAKQWSETTQQ